MQQASDGRISKFICQFLSLLKKKNPGASNVFLCLIRHNSKRNLFESQGSIFKWTSSSLTTDLLHLNLLKWALTCCVGEKVSPVQDSTVLDGAAHRKSDHQRNHTKNETSHKVERLCNVKSLELFYCTILAHGVEQSLPGADGRVPGSGGWPPRVLAQPSN